MIWIESWSLLKSRLPSCSTQQRKRTGNLGKKQRVTRVLWSFFVCIFRNEVLTCKRHGTETQSYRHLLWTKQSQEFEVQKKDNTSSWKQTLPNLAEQWPEYAVLHALSSVCLKCAASLLFALFINSSSVISCRLYDWSLYFQRRNTTHICRLATDRIIVIRSAALINCSQISPWRLNISGVECW